MDAAEHKMGLPPNVIRPTPQMWGAWEGAPAPYAGRSLELGELLGLKEVGANVCTLPVGARGCPLHYHLVEEELFCVIEGELTVRELDGGAASYREYTLRAGDLVAYPPNTAIAHQFSNRSDSEVRYLSLSNGWAPHEVAVYPDSGKTLVRGRRTIGVFGADGPAEAHIEAARAAATARSVERLVLPARPAWVAGPDTVPERLLGGGVHGRALARAAGATRIFLNRDRLAPGAVSGPLHWHTADDELLLVLLGQPTLRQRRDGTEERAVLQPGDAVGWRAGDRVAHQLLCEGDTDAVVLVVGTDRPDDVMVFPESDQIGVRALHRSGRLQGTDYWAGER